MKKLNFYVGIAFFLAITTVCDMAIAQSMLSYKRYWDADKPLSLDEFKVKSELRDSTISCCATDMELVPGEEVIDGIKYKYYKFTAYMDLEDCYVVYGHKSEPCRLYNQNFLDLTELNSRIATNELWNNNNSYDEVQNYYYRRIVSKSNDVSMETKKGRDSVAIERVHAELEADLKNAIVDPKYSFLMKTKRFAAGGYLGLGYMSGNDYYSDNYGICMGFDYVFKNNLMLGLDLSAYFCGSVEKSYYKDDDFVDKGSDYSSGNLTARLGYVACDGNRVKLTPYCAFGYKSMNALVDGRDKGIEKSAFTYGIGCNIDFVVKKVRYLRRDIMIGSNRPFYSKTSSEMNQSIRLTPSVSWADFSGMGKMRFFGLSLSYTIMQRLYK
jgi:hypothetical protein